MKRSVDRDEKANCMQRHSQGKEPGLWAAVHCGESPGVGGMGRGEAGLDLQGPFMPG